MGKILWQEPSRWATMLKKLTPYLIFLGLFLIATWTYNLVWEGRFEKRLKWIESKSIPTIDAPVPVEPNPHIEHINVLENEAGMPLSRIAQIIIQEESVSSVPYSDSNGAAIGVGRNLTTNGVSVAELHAIVGDIDYEYVLSNTSVRNGRIYVKSVDIANQIFRKPLSEEDIELLLADDLKNVTMEAISVFGSDLWNQIGEPRREAIIDILFNLGLPHFKQFVNFIDAVKQQDWKQAASELLLSEAARQNYSRYNHVALVIDTGDEKYFNLSK